MLKRAEYPKHLHIGSAIYKVKFVRGFKDKTQVGECCPADLEIRIKQGQTQEETFTTFIHEILHALLEYENDIEVKHKLIYALEKPLYQFIRDNVFMFRNQK